MKNTILIITLLVIYSCKAQMQQSQNIIPVQNHIEYIINEIELPDYTYLKDVNLLFDKFIGTWVGTFNNNNYEITIQQYLYQSNIRPILIDELLLRYKVTDINGNVLADTTTLPDDSVYVIEGRYFHENIAIYQLSYNGYECHHTGDFIIAVVNNNTQLNVGFVPPLELDCPFEFNQSPQLFPASFTLTKQ